MTATWLQRAVLGLSCLALAWCCETKKSEGIEVGVPFDFYAEDTRLPAGRYRAKLEGEKEVVLKEFGNGAELKVRAVRRISLTTHNPEFGLIFHRFGEESLLAEIWFGADGRQIAVTHYPQPRADCVPQRLVVAGVAGGNR